MRLLLFIALVVTLVPGAPLPAAAQPDDTITAVRLAPGEAPRLDGTLDHPAWQRAPVWERFIAKDPVFGVEPPARTQVRVLFDDRAIWVGVIAFDDAPERIRDVPVRADLVRRTQDFVVVYIDAIGSRQSAQFFRVNAAGSTADGIHTAADDSEDFSPDFDWDAAVTRRPDGWSVVFRLPFASLRFAEGRQDWRFMVGRRMPREQFHLFTSVPIPRNAPSFIDRLQPLAGVELPADHAFLTLRPSVTLRRQRDDGRGRSDADASLDIKWRPRAELLVDATLNPDFSQVALDVPQLTGNTRFALSFPEKRPFFFESADLLRSPTEAFYTRSFTAPRWGLRGTWRGSTVSGSAFAIDDRGGGLVLLPGPYGTDAASQPASRTLATRGRGDWGALQVGGLVAARRYENGQGENTVLGPDVGWQIDDAWRVRAQWLHASTSAFTGGRTEGGDRAYAKLWRQGDSSEFNLAWDESTAGFRHDSGFVVQNGVRHVTAFGSRRLPEFAGLNQFWLNLQLEQVRERSSGLVVSQDIRPGFYANGASNLEWWLEAHPQSRVRLAADRPLLTERYVQSGLTVTPREWFPLLDTNLSVGRLADAAAGEVRPGLRWTTTFVLRPLRRLELEPTWSLAWLRDGDRMAYRESALQWLAVWHLDARQTLRLITQRGTLDRRAEDNVAAARSSDRVASLTYAWRRSAGTVLYVGASRQRRAGDSTSRTSEAFVKLQVDVDEVRAGIGP